MTGNFHQDWPIYVLSGAVIFFFAYVFIKGSMQDKHSKLKDDNKEVKK